MRASVLLLLLATLAATLLALAAATLAEPQVETRPIPPNGSVERNLELREGDRVAWTITVVEPQGTTVVYDIHTHAPNGTVETLEAGGTNTTLSGTFTAPRDGTFSWQLTNALGRRTMQVTLSTEIRGAEDPAPAPSNPIPAPGALAALAALAGGGLLRRRPPRRPTMALQPPPRRLAAAA